MRSEAIQSIKEQAQRMYEGDSDPYDGADAARTVIDLCNYIEDLERRLAKAEGN